MPARRDALRLLMSLRQHPLRPVGGLGLLATTLVVIGGTLAGAADDAGEAGAGVPGRLWGVPSVPVEPRVDLLSALAVFYVGLILLVRAWLGLRRLVRQDEPTDGTAPRRRPGLASVAAVVVIWAVPLVLGPPLGSRDVYAYVAQGRAAEVGVDVYEEGPAAMGVDPVLAPVDPLYLDAPVVYGPLFVSLSSAVATAAEDTVGMVFTFRALAVLGLAVAAVGVCDIARRLGRDPVDAFVLAVANPLVLLHLVSGAHNEALMLALLVGGVAIGLRPRWRLLGVALCAVAAAIKLPGVVGAAFLAWPWVLEGRLLTDRIRRALLVAAEVFVVVAGVGRLTGWGWGWVDALMSAEPVDAYLSVTRLAGGAVHAVVGVEAATALGAARSVGLVFAGGGTAWLLLRERQVAVHALAGSLLLVAVLHPTTQPWYLTWGLLLWAAASAGAENRGYVIGTAVAAFAVLPVGPRVGTVLVEQHGLPTLAVLSVLLLGSLGYAVTRPPGEAVAPLLRQAGLRRMHRRRRS